MSEIIKNDLFVADVLKFPFVNTQTYVYLRDCYFNVLSSGKLDLKNNYLDSKIESFTYEPEDNILYIDVLENSDDD